MPWFPTRFGAGRLGSDSPDAVILGRYYDPAKAGTGDRMRYGGDRHVLVFGPNGSGKGMRLLVPNLLQCEGRSMFVIDPKGELAAITAPHRRTLGRVVVLNPFGVLTHDSDFEDLKSEGFNPLLSLDPDLPSFNADAALLADALIKIEGKDPHWDASARAMLAALIMYVVLESYGRTSEPDNSVEPPGPRLVVSEGKVIAGAGHRPNIPTMKRVRFLLCEAAEEPSARNDFKGRGLPALALKMMDTQLAGLRNKAGQFVDWTNEVRSIASAAKRQTEPFDDNEIADDLAKGTFDFRDMKREPTTVYLILPPEMMERHSKWLRLVLSSALQGVMRAREPHEPRILFMLDEFAALGHLQIIETVWALVRGYGIQIMPVLQDMSQLKGIYQDRWETFIGMAGAVLTFAPNDMTTAKWFAERAGDATRVIASYNSGAGYKPRGGGSNEGISYQQSKVPLLVPHQLFGMGEGNMLALLAGLSHVVPAYAPAHWEIRQCRERARRNPYHIE